MAENDKYFSWTVEQLKSELIKRGASTKGRKNDLQDRLRLYDDNNNLILSDIPTATDAPDPTLWTPSDQSFRDVNAHTPVPAVTEKQIRLLLERFNVKKDLGKEMYQAAYLLCLRIASVNSFFYFRGYCLAQMKRNVQYKIDVCISSNGFIEATHCECAVGSGVTAYCKHVAVLLWAIEEMVREKKVITRAVCTQRLQSFHKPSKAYFGTPIKADRLPKRKADDESEDREPVVLAPDDYDADYLNYKIRNDCINFAAVNKTTMPMLRLYKPADLYSAIWDHHYTATNPEEQLLKEFQLTNITDQEISNIERQTRNQADSKVWYEHRRHRITASNFHKCCIMRTDDEQQIIAYQMINPIPFKNKAIVWGKLNEPVALTACQSLGVKIKSCGLFVSKSHPYLGASPDGLIGGTTTIEIKCPYAQRYSVIDETTIPYLRSDDCGVLMLSKKHPYYYYQIQGQLFVTGRLLGQLVVFTTKEIAIVDVPRDDGMITEMVQRLENFYRRYFKPALFNEYIYKRFSRVFEN